MVSLSVHPSSSSLPSLFPAIPSAAHALLLSTVVGTSSKELDWLISAQPRTKDDFVEFSDKIIEYIIKRHQGKPLYAAFLEHHVRELAMPLRDVEVRKVASALRVKAEPVGFFEGIWTGIEEYVRVTRVWLLICH